MKAILCALALLFYSAEYLPPRVRNGSAAPAVGVLVVGGIFSTIPTPAIRAQRFTANGTWVCPAGVTKAYLTGTACGGGGGGENNAAPGMGGGGGGGDAVVRKDVAVVPGTSYSVTVPATGGAAGVAGNPATDGTAGANTVFGALLTLTGGGGGKKGLNPGHGQGGARGGAGAQDGGDGNVVFFNYGGFGGGNILAPGGLNLNVTNLLDAPAFGVGGNGGGTTVNAVVGGAGVLLVEW